MNNKIQVCTANILRQHQKITSAALLFISLGFFSTHTLANLEAQFIEGAPKDTFIIKNTGRCAITNTTIAINLSPSKGQLIFDTSETGAGVEVYQPFEITAGGDALTSDGQTLSVSDGDQQLALPIQSLASGQTVSFTIDVDDNLTNSIRGKTQVVGSEMQGATIGISALSVASFNSNNSATVSIPC